MYYVRLYKKRIFEYKHYLLWEIRKAPTMQHFRRLKTGRVIWLQLIFLACTGDQLANVHAFSFCPVHFKFILIVSTLLNPVLCLTRKYGSLLNLKQQNQWGFTQMPALVINYIFFNSYVYKSIVWSLFSAHQHFTTNCPSTEDERKIHTVN